MGYSWGGPSGGVDESGKPFGVVCPAATDSNGWCSEDADSIAPCWTHRPMNPPIRNQEAGR